MACINKILPNGNRSKLYDSLYDHYSNPKYAMYVYRNFKSMTGRTLPADTKTDENNEPVIVFQKLELKDNPQVAKDYSYTNNAKQALPHSPAYTIATTEEIVEFGEFQLPNDARLTDVESLDTRMDIEYGTFMMPGATQFKIDDFHKELRKHGVTNIKMFDVDLSIKQLEKPTVFKQGSQINIVLDLNKYDLSEKIINRKETMLYDLFAAMFPDNRLDFTKDIFADTEKIPMFKQLLEQYPTSIKDKVKKEIASGVLHYIAGLDFDHNGVIRNAKYHSITNILRNLLSQSDYNSLSQSEKQDIDSFLANAINSYHSIIHKALDGYMGINNSITTNKIIAGLVKSLSDEKALVYIKDKIKVNEQMINDTNYLQNVVDKYIDYLVERRNKYIALHRALRQRLKDDDKIFKQLETAISQITSQLDKYSRDKRDADFISSLVTSHKIDLQNIAKVEELLSEALDTYLNMNVEDMSEAEQLRFYKIVGVINQFLATFEHIDNLENLQLGNLVGDAELLVQINDIIASIKSVQTRASKIASSFTALESKFIDVILSHVNTNLDLAELKKIMYSGKDITSVAATFGSLMDVSNVFAAQMKKDYTKHFEKRDLYIKSKQREFELLLAKHFPNMNEHEMQQAFERITDKAGRIVSEDNYDVYDELFDLRDKMLSAKELGDVENYVKYKNLYNKFIYDNFQHAYKDAYYSRFKLSAAAQDKLEEWEIAQEKVKQAVIAREGEYKPKYLTQSEKEELDSIAADRAQFLNSDSLLAQELDSYFKDMESAFDSDLTSDFPLDYNEAAAKGARALDIFLLKNTSKTNRFSAKLNALFKKKHINETRDLAKGFIKELLAPYKDMYGMYRMDEVPTQVLAQVKVINMFLANGKMMAVLQDPRFTIDSLQSLVNAMTIYTDIDELLMQTGFFQSEAHIQQIRESVAQMDFMPEQEYHALEKNPNYQDKLGTIARKVKNIYWENVAHNASTPQFKNLNYYYNPNTGNYELIDGWEVLMPKDPEIGASDEVNDLVVRSWYKENFSIKEDMKLPGVEQDYKYGLPKPKETNKTWNVLSDKDRALAKDLSKFLNDLARGNEIAFIRNGYAPAIEKGILSEYASVRGEKIEDEKIKEYEEQMNKQRFEFFYSVMQDATGATRYSIPARYMYKLNQKEYIKPIVQLENEDDNDYYKRLAEHVKTQYGVELKSDETILHQIKVKNEVIKQENIKAHRDSLDTNYHKTIPAFIQSVANLTFTLDMEDAVNLSMSIVKNLNINRQSSMGTSKYVDRLKQALNDKFGLELNTDVSSQGTSRLYRLMQDDIERNFYQRGKEPHTSDKYLDALRQYTSLVGMGFNVFAAVKNVGTGFIMTAAEAGGRMHFSGSDYRSAMRRYMAAAYSYMSDTALKKDKYSTKENALINFFNIVDDQLEDPYIDAIRDKYNKYKRAKGYWNKYLMAAYFMHRTGEHMMQNATLFAMLRSHRIYNGKIVSFREYLWHTNIGNIQSKLTIDQIRKDKRAFDTAMLEYKDAESKAKKEFEKLKSAEDMLIFSNGTLKYNPLYINEGLSYTDEGIIVDKHGNVYSEHDAFSDLINQITEFKIKVEKVNQNIHGIYTKRERGSIERNSLGALAMQFHHWMPEGWARRFGRGSFFNMEAQWNVGRNTFERGSYKTLLKYLMSPLEGGGVQNLTNQPHVFGLVQGSINYFRDLVSNWKRYWYVLEDWERAEARKTIYDFLLMAGVGLLYAMARGAGDDDKKLRRNLMYAFTVYSLSGVFAEARAWLPVYGWYAEVRKLSHSPVAALQSVMGVTDLLQEAIMYNFKTPTERVYRTSRYHHQNKVWIKLQQRLPGFIPAFGVNDQYFFGAQALRWSSLKDDMVSFNYFDKR